MRRLRSAEYLPTYLAVWVSACQGVKERQRCHETRYVGVQRVGLELLS